MRGQHAKSAWGKTISCTELLPPPQAGVFELFSHFEARIFGQRSSHPERFWAGLSLFPHPFWGRALPLRDDDDGGKGRG